MLGCGYATYLKISKTINTSKKYVDFLVINLKVRIYRFIVKYLVRNWKKFQVCYKLKRKEKRIEKSIELCVLCRKPKSHIYMKNLRTQW